MPSNRFFCPGPLVKEAIVAIKESEHHHLRVMRATVGEEVELVNGAGALATAKITGIHKESTELHVTTVFEASPLESLLILIIPLMRPGKLEWIVEKATELGADGLHLYAADFSEKMQLSSNQLERLHNLCLSALKQSGRLFLPKLEVLPSLERALVEPATYYYGDTSGSGKNLLEMALGKRTALITGPERGFSPDELALLAESAQGVSLSANILRAETAPLAGLSILALRSI